MRWQVCIGMSDEPAALDVASISHLGLLAVDALARLQLEARRRGGRIALTNASPELAELIDLAGLRSVLPCLESVELIVEVGGQAEEREEPRRVEEEGDPADPVA